MTVGDPNNPEKFCETRLLDDAPATEDAFGAHQRVADAITQLVTGDDGGKAVALVGGYGSGKSTVVQLAKGALERKATTKVVVFDSWSHQGDPLRRSFLEELIRLVTEAGWTATDSWSDDLDALSGKREASRTITNPRLSPAGRFVALGALFVPLGYLLLAASFADKTKLPASFLQVPTLWWGLLFSFAPLLAVIAVYFWLRPNLKLFSRGFWIDHRGRPRGESVWAAFLDRTVQEHETETVKTPDPTSVEFQRIFSRLMESCLTKARTLVVVVDNLDRLPREEAQTIWATMQTFFGSARSKGDWHQRLWLLVPFNQDGLAKIWPDGPAPLGEPTKTYPDRQTPVSESFVEKTFQAVFRVSPPILSDWREFFLQSLAKAFPSHTGPEFDRIYRLYRRIAAPADRPVTPRELKTFINKVGVLHRQWHDDMSLVVMATFVLVEPKLGTPSETLTDPSFLDSGIRAILGDVEWSRDFAALHFNVPQESSVQVLISRQVETGLTQGSREDLSRLAQIPGFEAVCQSVVEDKHNEWVGEDDRSVLNAASMLMDLESGRPALHAMTELVLGDLQGIQKWVLTEKVAESIVEVAESARDDVRPLLARRFIEQTSESSPPEGLGLDGLTDWAAGYMKVIRQLPPMVAGHAWEGVGVPGRPEDYVAVLPQLADLTSYPETQGFLVPKHASPTQVIQVLTELVTSERFDPMTLQSVRVMLRLKLSWPWDGFVDALDQRLRAVSPEVATKAAPILSLLALAAHGVASALKGIAGLGSGGFVNHHIHLAAVAGDNDAMAALVLAQLLYNAAGDVTSHVGQSVAGQTLYKAVLASPDSHAAILDAASAKVEKTAQVETLIANAEGVAAAKPTVIRLLSRLLAGADGAELVAAQHFVANYARYAAMLEGASLTELVKYLMRRESFLDALVDHGFARELGPLYRTVWSISGTSAPTFEALVTTGLRAMDKADWDQEMVQGQLPELVGAMAKAEVDLALGPGLEDALLDYGKTALGGASPRALACGWSAVLAGLSERARKTLLRDIRDELVGRPDGHVGSLLEIFGSDLLSSGLLMEQADEVLRKVGRAMIERGDVNELNWLERLLVEQPAILQSAAAETVPSLVDRVTDARSAANENPSLEPLLNRIFIALGGKEEVESTTESAGEQGNVASPGQSIGKQDKVASTADSTGELS
jgi:energy-coupling factor transporter ATP-binding protein EcfA2